MWTKSDYSAPSILQNGAFAEPWTTQDWDDSEDTLNKYFAASAINSVWTSQQVFIAKGSGSVHEKALKDLVFEFNLVDD